MRSMGEMCDRLAALGTPVPDEWQILILLASLRPSCRPLTQSFNVQAKIGKLKLPDVDAAVIKDGQGSLHMTMRIKR